MQDTAQIRVLFEIGSYQECIACCDGILKENPNEFHALKWAGKSLLALGRHEQAQQYLTRAYQLDQSDPEVLKDIGNCFLNKGNHEQAAKAYKRCLAIQANYVPAIYNLAGIAQISGDYKSAIGLFLRSVELDNSLSQAWIGAARCALAMGHNDATISLCRKALATNNTQKGIYQVKGDAHRGKGELDQALEAYEKEHKISPGDPSPLINASNIMRTQGRLDDAINLTAKALELRPEDWVSLSNLGCMLNDTERFEEAEHYCRRATMLNPEHAEAYGNLALALLQLGRIDEAISAGSRAISLAPSKAGLHTNLGSICIASGKYDEAINHLLQAISFDPLDQEARTGLACIQLAKGEYLQGWDGYSYRPKKPCIPSIPVWDRTIQKTVLVIGEQGIGDQILYAALIPEAQAFCERLELRVDRRLVPLFQRSLSGNINIDSLDTLLEQKSSHDFHVAMADLGKLFRQGIVDFPRSDKGYLITDSHKVSELSKKLQGRSNRKIIGLSWHSTGRGYKNKVKSVDLEEVATSLRHINAEFVSLQYGDHSQEIDSLRNTHGIDIRIVEDLDLFNDIDGLAALISVCDAVVTISNSTAHLAGALGKETHLLVPCCPNFYWGLDSSKTPWYPSATVYRQTVNGNWSEAINAICVAVSASMT